MKVQNHNNCNLVQWLGVGTSMSADTTQVLKLLLGNPPESRRCGGSHRGGYLKKDTAIAWNRRGSGKINKQYF
jgi:hypothetical protein